MTLPAPDLSLMKQDISGLITDWGVSCKIRRRAQTRNSAGQISGAFASVGTETMWIQPVDARVYRLGEISDRGIDDSGYFQYFERFSGTALQAGDQILASGETYVYDVLAVQVLSNHRTGFVRQVKRA